jgi:hypothetical protein
MLRTPLDTHFSKTLLNLIDDVRNDVWDFGVVDVPGDSTLLSVNLSVGHVQVVWVQLKTEVLQVHVE